MARPWEILADVATADGKLELRRRGPDEFLIVIGGRVLMTSTSRRSEEALATLAFDQLARPPARALVAGLGMGFTLRAALDAAPGIQIDVAELNRDVVEWCRGPLAASTRGAVLDPRVHVTIADVASVIAAAPPTTYDAILLDLHEGPHAATQRANDPFYGAAALARTRAALTDHGVLAVWSEDADAAFARRFERAGFTVSSRRIGGGGRRHLVYLGTR